MARPFDVCIRGAGITGRVLALLLARERLRVALVAADRGPTQSVDDPAKRVDAAGHGDVRAYALNLASKKILESFRCWPSGATPVLAMQVYGDDGGEVNFAAEPVRHPDMRSATHTGESAGGTPSESAKDASSGTAALAWIVDVPSLENLLAQATQFQPLIETVPAPVPAALTVICEGRNSQTRDELGVEFDVQSYGQVAIATRVTSTLAHQQVARQWFAGDAAGGEILGLLPLGESAGGNSLAVVWSVPNDRAAHLMQLAETPFCEALQAATHSRLGSLSPASNRAQWPLMLAKTRRWVGRFPQGGAWALAGDAAHAVHPLSGQGLNLGLADVAELASLIAKRDYFRTPGDEKLLRQYERSRKFEAALLAGATDGLQRLFAQPGKTWQGLRNMGLSIFDQSGRLKSWVAGRAMGADSP